MEKISSTKELSQLFDEWTKSSKFRREDRADCFPRKREEFKQWKTQFEKSQASAPWDVDNFSDELKKDPDVLNFLARWNPFQVHKLSKEFFTDRRVNNDFMVWWLSECLVLTPWEAKHHFSEIKYLLKITLKDTWFYQALVDTRIFSVEELPKTVAEKIDINPPGSNSKSRHQRNPDE